MSRPGLTRLRGLGRRSGVALLLLAGAAVMSAGVLLQGPARAVVVLPLALLLPGAAVLVAVRGYRPAHPATDSALAVVISFALWILIALVCFVIRQPLTTGAFVVGSDLVVAAAAALCSVRAARPAALVGARARPAQLVPLALFLMAAAACAATVALGARVAPKSTVAPYSEIMLAGEWAKAATSIAVTPGAHVAVELRVTNHTARTKTYELVPAMRDGEWPEHRFTLAPGTSWHGHVRGTIPPGGCLHRLSVALRDKALGSQVGSVTLWFQHGTRLVPECTP